MNKITAARILDKQCERECSTNTGCTPRCPAFFGIGAGSRICKRDEITAMAHPIRTFFKNRAERRKYQKDKAARAKVFTTSKGETIT